MEEVTIQQQLALPANYERSMTPEMARKANDLKLSIDIHDKDKVIAFGREEQAQIGRFSDSILSGVATKSVGEAGELLTNVIGKIKGFDVDCQKENSGFLSFLKKQKSKLQNMQTKYKSLADNMATVEADLKQKDMDLVQVSRNFDTMYKENEALYAFLTMMIFAGEQAVEEERAKHAQMLKEAEKSGDMMELQSVSNFKDDIERFERRIRDLRLTRAISGHQGPQIKNIQKSADEVSESIRATIVTAIPMWKNQMVMALGMQVIREGLNAVNAVRDATNAMLIANSQMNKELTLEAAQASQRGIVDIETVNILNQNLIEALSGSNEIAQKAITAGKEEAMQLQANEDALRKAIVKYGSLS